MTDPLDFKFVDNLRPPCSKCGRPLVLTKIEPEEPGFDLRTYYCSRAKAPSSLSLRFEAVVFRTNRHFSDRFRAHHGWMAERVQDTRECENCHAEMQPVGKPHYRV